ncbi:eCIS core domain-containing protein [Pedobacter sp. GSP4]|uniref:eCIS core domain-containing protein n=1 Tax=Pedobacter sp. GSP4 TaxID=3453716 RepID=UPI003EEF4881
MSTALAYGNSLSKPVTNSRPGNGCVQTKLKVGAVNDPQEKEADQVAERVMRMPSNAGLGMSGLGAAASPMRVQRKCSSCGQDKKIARKETAVMRTLSRPSIQRKCATCAHEEQVAPKVKPVEQKPKLQRKCTSCEHEEQVSRKEKEPIKPKLQRKCASSESKEKLSRKAEEIKEIDQPKVLQAKSESASAAGGTAPASVQSGISATRGGGTTLPGHISSDLGSKMGADFSGVRIHDTSHAAKMNDSINARAFTVGNNIYFNKGEYNPNSQGGKFLLAHELTHTMQQGASPEIQRYSWDEFANDVADGVDTVGEGLSDAADTVGDAASAVGEAVGDAAGAVYDAGVEAVDWLATEAGEAAQALADYFGVSVNITSSGLEIDIPGGCPLDAHAFQFTLPTISKDFMVPIFELPIPPSLVIAGEIGITGSITPEVGAQIGPICFDPTHILINPLTSNYSISGGISITSALSLGATFTGGLKGQLRLFGILPVGDIPIPVNIPVIGAEGGPAVFIRAIGAQTTHIGGSLGYSGGVITASPDFQFDLGLAADLFAGAYAQLSVLGLNLCRIYWEPYQWHGDAAASLGLSGSVSWGGPGGLGISLAPPTFSNIPFDDIPLAINRERGFTDDCPLITGLCGILKALGYLPLSLHGGNWDDTGTGHGGRYGPGPRLAGPIAVYKDNPGIASGALCRGACGVNCDTCKMIPVHPVLDPATGIVWEYHNFQDCNTHEGCRQHDAGFDWAADAKGETGRWAMILPWHMAANIECGCNNLAGNCPAWAIGLPPYDGKIYFADSVTPKSSGTPIIPNTPPGGGGPNNEVGPDFYHYSINPPSGDFAAGGERWTDYKTDCRAEAQAATGVPDNLQYISTLPNTVANAYIDRSNFTVRPRMSVVHGILYPYYHYRNHTVIPARKYHTAALTVFSPNCDSPSGFSDDTWYDRTEQFDDVNNQHHLIFVRGSEGNRVEMMASEPITIVKFLQDIIDTTASTDPKHVQAVAAQNLYRTGVAPNLQKLNTIKVDDNTGRAVNPAQQADLEKYANDFWTNSITLTAMLRSLIGRENLSDIRKRYALEGLAGTYGSVPIPKGDQMTGDHQPQAAALIYSAAQPYFPASHPIKDVLDGSHAPSAYVINLHKYRHEAGRTFGPKSSPILKAFTAAVDAIRLDKNKKPKEKRAENVDLLKNELSADVQTMRGVVNQAETHDNWKDLGEVGFTGTDKTDLYNELKTRILQGEQAMLTQNLDRYKT